MENQWGSYSSHTLANYGNKNYTSFRSVNLKDDTVRFENNTSSGFSQGLEGTLSISNTGIDGLRSWNLPNKSGVLPISGTFAFQIPAAGGNANFFSTIVTVAGIRADDGLTFNYSERGTYTFGGQGTRYIFLSATPGAGNITLFFSNVGNGTGYIELQGNYTAVRS